MSHLQLCQQDHPGTAIEMHALPLPAASRQLCQEPTAICHRQRKVGTMKCCTIASSAAIIRCRHSAQSLVKLLDLWETLSCLHRVNMAEGGLDAVVTLGAGDMRRTLNILQVYAPSAYRPDRKSVLGTDNARQSNSNAEFAMLPWYTDS